MESKIYYGEYTLKQWVNMMLSGSIALPEYQRSFVWAEKDVRGLFKSLLDNQFVPPVTLAHFDSCQGGEKANLILDGQQRLTSLLLAYLSCMPDKEKFKDSDSLASGDDSAEEGDAGMRKSIEWRFDDMLDSNPKNNGVSIIRERVKKDDRYHGMIMDGIKDMDDFYENHYMGFSYIVPQTDKHSSTDIQKYFATLFRNMNYLGVKLSNLESRRSLYFMNDDFKDYFNGAIDGADVLCGIGIKENMRVCKLDFVRYLSMLSQFTVTQNTQKVMVGYSSYGARENYYADYVSYVLGLEQSEREDKFNGFEFAKVFPKQEWRQRFKKFKDTLDVMVPEMSLTEQKAFASWIDADYWLFGLIYHVIFQGEEIAVEDSLYQEIRKCVDMRRCDENYVRNTNRLGQLRDRMEKSIEIYGRYGK